MPSKRSKTARARSFARALVPGLILGKHLNCERVRRIGFHRNEDDETPCTHDRLIRYEGEGHVMTIAPTGSGKTSGPVINNALNHPGQLIALDLKGELLQTTARRRREMGQKVYVLDMRDEAIGSDALNPIDLAARCGSEPAAIARTLASEMIERGAAEQERFWNDWAETGIAGGIAHLLSDCPPGERRLSRLHDLFGDDDPSMAIAKLLDSGKVKNKAAHTALAGILQLPEQNTRPSVIGTIAQHLRLFDSMLIRRLTDSTTIDLDALVAGEPMTIYICVPPVRLGAFKPVLRAWLSGLMYLLMQRRSLPEHRTLLLCDEIAALGRMESFVTATTLMRGWGVTIWSFWQNPATLDVYGRDARTLVDNAGVLQMFCPRNMRVAGEYANLLGGLDAEQVMALPADQQCLLIEGGRPMTCGQIRYFDEAMFAGLYDQNSLVANKREARRSGAGR